VRFNFVKILIFIIPMLIISLVIFYYPQIELKGDKYIKINLGEGYIEEGVIAKVRSKDISDKVVINGSVDSQKVGKYSIEYVIDLGIINKKVKRIVEVLDTVSPTIDLIGNKEVFVCPNSAYIEEGYNAVDNYDGDITNLVKINEKDNLILYTVTDSSNNEAIAERKIIKKDTDNPNISLIGQSTMYILLNSNYKEQGVTVSDNCDKDIMDKVTIKGNVNTKVKGNYKITYEVEDSSGNKSSVERKVIVYEKASNKNGINKTGTIYLTFDDGPSATITPKVLKILKEKGVKATFFVINHSDKLDYLIKQAYDEGHTLALHSYTHDYKKIYSSPEAYFSDLKKISDKVKKITGIESKIMRFPGGSSNTVSKSYSKGIMTYLSNEVLNRGYHYFDWNVSSLDAGGAKTKEQVYKNVVNNLKFNRANIVLMHDFENNYKTLNALSDIIDYGLANGYEFLSIDMTTPLVRHGVNN